MPDSQGFQIPFVLVIMGFAIALFIGLMVFYSPLMQVAGVLAPFVNTNSFDISGYVNGVYTVLDYGILGIVVLFIFVQLNRDYHNPEKLKAFIYLGAFFIVGFLWAYAVGYLNQFLPYYTGGTPTLLALVTSGIMPYLIMFALALGVIFNMRKTT